MFKDTKHKIIALTHITIAIYKFNPTTGGSIVLPDYITKNQNVVSYPYDNNLCFWSAVWNQFCDTEKKNLRDAQIDIKN